MEDESNISVDNKQLVGARLANGTIVYLQAQSLGGELDVGIKFTSFEKVAKTLEGIAESLAGVWKKVEPSKASVEFDVEFVWEAGDITAMFVNSSTTASMKITLEWSKAPTDSSTMDH